MLSQVLSQLVILPTHCLPTTTISGRLCPRLNGSFYPKRSCLMFPNYWSFWFLQVMKLPNKIPQVKFYIRRESSIVHHHPGAVMEFRNKKFLKNPGNFYDMRNLRCLLLLFFSQAHMGTLTPTVLVRNIYSNREAICDEQRLEIHFDIKENVFHKFSRVRGLQ